MTTKTAVESKTKIHHRYYKEDGTRVPSSTTALSILAKPALIDWAWKMGMEGEDYRKYRDDKGEIGTLAHHMILCDAKGIKPNTDNYSKRQIDLAENCLLSYYEWEKGHQIKDVLIEEPLVSEKYGFGGTPDRLAYVDGILTLLDYKTGKGIYEEYYYQTCSYEKLIEECKNQYPERIMILNIPRDEDEEFALKVYKNFDKGWEIFYNCLQIYKLRRS